MTSSDTTPVVECDDVVSIFTSSRQPTVALQRVNLVVPRGESLAITGPSGSGKSTLLGLLLGTLTPTAGAVRVFGGDPQELGRSRIKRVGTTVQLPSQNLLLTATGIQNISMIRRAAKRPKDPTAVRTLLESLGLGHVADRAAGSLSGGEQQRLAIAIALCTEPDLVLTDEPTSQQDRASADLVVQALQAANRDHGTTVVAVTHDPLVASAMGRSITIRDGILGSESRAGRQVILVREDGTIQLPTGLLETTLPPGSAVEITATDGGAVINRVDREPPDVAD